MFLCVSLHAGPPYFATKLLLEAFEIFIYTTCIYHDKCILTLILPNNLYMDITKFKKIGDKGSDAESMQRQIQKAIRQYLIQPLELFLKNIQHFNL